MFKVGDRVRVKRNRSNCSIRCDGSTRIIKEVYPHTLQMESYVVLNCIHSGIWIDECTLIKNKPANEIEFLDAFLENYKEGI